ncbi:hypothetical protein [Sinomonas mesophila]|uniref:hypothetical protein n=1 Tax=Sinomonas mesophila TaxID=1531955 RepID=UPI0009851BEF|nr:hypothetical protein [Sinomonas mesophila]
MARRKNGLALEQALLSTSTRPIDPVWHTLDTGDRVRVTFPDGIELDGTFDARTPDSTVVWIVADGGGRRMLHPGDGLAVVLA